MTALLDSVRGWLAVSLVVLCAGLAWTTSHYRDRADACGERYATLQAQVQQQNREAETKLAELTRERDAKQAELDNLHTIQEQKDAAAKREIARLATELEHRPVRVRVVAQPSAGGDRGGSTEGDTPAPTNAGSGDAAETHWVLPEGNARRLGEVIAEAETINAAYASCRARLVQGQ